MSEINTAKTLPKRKVRYNGREQQMLVYLGKLLRLFINQSDWKVLPMAAIIAALVSMVIRKRLFINMEGSLIGGFALTCVAIWNGCFNSIQSVCRERPIIKREHRSGMHITSYVGAHMVFQFLLCLAQTAMTLYIMKLVGVRFPEEGVITPWMIVDIGISMLLISYASDMMSLFMSSITHTTTGAMTLMPFVLIFQLIFSGGIIPLPAWSQRLSNFTISNYGIRAIASQSGYNEMPMVTPWNTVLTLKDNEIGGTVSLGEIMSFLDSPVVDKYRDREVVKSYTVGEVAQILSDAEEYLNIRDRKIAGDLTLGDVLDELHRQEEAEGISSTRLNEPVTLGQLADTLKHNRTLQAMKDRTFTLKTTVGDLLDLFGEEKVQELVQEKTAAAARKPEYDKTVENIVGNWIMLALFILLFATLSIISLKMIDKDKR